MVTVTVCVSDKGDALLSVGPHRVGQRQRLPGGQEIEGLRIGVERPGQIVRVGWIALTGPGVTDSMFCTSALVSPPVVPPSVTPVTTAAVTVSETSASVTVSVPLVISAALVSGSVAAALSVDTIWMSGASLVPVMVTVTVCVSDKGDALLSVARTV